MVYFALTSRRYASGRSFRPEYCKLPQFASDIEAERILCLASIATPATIAELCAPSPNGFSIDTEKGVFRSGMNRENISLIVHQAPGLKDKIRSLVDFLEKLDGGAAIIYVTTPRHVRERTGELKQHGFQEVMSCHGKMSREDKDSVRDKFNAEGGIVVATTAFGTGVYRRDIRAIVHFDPPMTLEKYSEQIERVGRDGKPADCLLLHSYGDWNFLEGLMYVLLFSFSPRTSH
jgi:ATP-dependent DNA helicase RecQ